MYTTFAELCVQYPTEEIVSLTDRTNSGVLNESILNLAIARAVDDIHAKLAKAYTVPFAEPIPTTIKTICRNLTMYYLYSDVGIRTGITDEAKALYTNAMKSLEAMRDGKDTVQVAATEGEDPANKVKPATAMYLTGSLDGKVFSAERMAGYR